jgi:hypothetical protein
MAVTAFIFIASGVLCIATIGDRTEEDRVFYGADTRLAHRGRAGEHAAVDT